MEHARLAWKLYSRFLIIQKTIYALKNKKKYKIGMMTTELTNFSSKLPSGHRPSSSKHWVQHSGL